MLFMIVLYLIIPAAQVFWFVAAQPFFQIPDLINYAASIVMFHWMLNGVLLSAKIPVFQRYLPYDQRIRWHILGNLGIVAMFVYHVSYKFLLGKEITIVSWGLLALFASMMLVSMLWIPLPVVQHARKWILATVRHTALRSYDVLKKVHSLLFVAMSGFVLLHVLQADVFSQVPLVSTLLYLGIYLSALSAYLVALLRLRFLPRVTIESISENAGVHTIRFRAPRPLRYRAGQFAFLRFDHPDLRGEEHPFSFLSSPADKHISFGVKILGDFTTALSGLKVGDSARINAGFGNFRSSGDPAPVFIASGIGVVPFVSLLKDMHARGDNRPVDFHLALRNQAEIPDAAVLAELDAAMPNLKLNMLLSDNDPRLYSYEYFQEQLELPHEHTYYICSSPKVRVIIVEALMKLGVKRKAIRYETFSFS